MTGLPLWAAFGFLAAALSASQMLLQEKFKTSPLPMALWSKVACALIMMPFVIGHGLPNNPFFYLLVAAQSLLWVVSDIIFYRSINKTGAAVISRILPIATIIGFFLWFALDWDLASAYIATPVHSVAVLTVLCLLAGFAWRLKTCAVTMNALRNVWFVLFASVIGSVSTKYITQQIDINQGVYTYIFCNALIMIVMFFLYYAIKKPIPAKIMFGAAEIKAGFAVGAVVAGATASTLYAVYHIDNPAYVSAVRYLDAVLILLYYRATNRPSKGHIWAGLGIVACAAALVVLKAHG